MTGNDINAIYGLWGLTVLKEAYELGLIDKEYLVRFVKGELGVLHIPTKEDTHEDHPVVET